MAITPQCADKLLGLHKLAAALADIAETAITTADGDDPSTDSMMGTVRKVYLGVKSLGDDFLSISSGTSVVRKLGSAITAAVQAHITETVSSEINLEPSSSYSLASLRNRVNAADPNVPYSAIVSAFNAA